MNLTAVYLQTKARYLQAPSWENFFALLGALLLKWPALTKRPLSCSQIRGFIKGLGIEIWETELTACHGLATSFRLKDERDREFAEAKDVQDSFDEPVLYRKDTFWSIVELLRRGGGKVILLRPGLSPEVKAFVLAHELGHHLLGHIDQGCRIENWLQEIHADVFATWLSDVNSPWRSREERRWIRKIIGTGPTRGRTRGSLAPRSSFEFRTQNFDVIH